MKIIAFRYNLIPWIKTYKKVTKTKCTYNLSGNLIWQAISVLVVMNTVLVIYVI